MVWQLYSCRTRRSAGVACFPSAQEREIYKTSRPDSGLVHAQREACFPQRAALQWTRHELRRAGGSLFFSCYECTQGLSKRSYLGAQSLEFAIHLPHLVGQANCFPVVGKW